MSLANHIEEQARQVDRNPTEPQKKAGNYAKGHVKIHGLDVSIENPRGSWRTGGPEGKKWKARLPHHYGYIRKTEGADGDHVDIYIGPHLKAPHAFIIDQHNLHGGKSFDEHKVMLGFGSKQQAIEAYHRAFSDGRGKDRIGHVETMTIDGFKHWLANGDTTQPVKHHDRERLAKGGAVNGHRPSDVSDRERAEKALPPNHKLGMRVPQGGSMCANCRFLASPTTCGNAGFVKWNGGAELPAPSHEYCCDLYEHGKERADGGRVHMAEGGTPVTDPDILSQLNAPAPVTDPKILEQLNAPDVGGFTAAMRGAEQGATFGFGDELRGLYAAGPQMAGRIPFIGPVAQPIIGAGRMAKEYLMGGDQTATTEYQKARDEARAADELAKSQHPYLHAAGELAGSIPAMAMLPGGELAEGANLATKMVKGAQVGAEYGGLSGLGEGKDIGDSAMKAAEGIVGGIVGGAAAPVVGAGLSKVAEKVVSPAVGAIRGAMNPEAEASRRLAAALQKDQNLIAAGKAEGMSPQDWINARHAGEPVTLADLGSSNTQALLRSSANTSPEGRAILEKVLNDRFAAQTERVADTVRNLVSGGANAGKTADQLVAEYDVGRAPLYKKAFAQPSAQGMWDGDFAQMAQAPSVQDAIRLAGVNAKEEAAKLRMAPPPNPFQMTPDGRMILRQIDPKDPLSQAPPNLQFWDVVKKNLDANGSREAQQWAKVLRNKLDSVVPEYGQARGFAANFFGERDALEAGRSLAGKRVDPEMIKTAMRKMSPQEQDLFREGYASDWANRVISNISDTRDITKAMFNSPNERARALAVFGPAGLAKIQTRMTLETIMDGARKAMGNSTTARQLIEAGLAGGALEGYLQGGDWQTAMSHGAAGALAGAGMGHSAIAREMAGQMAAGAGKLIGRVDSRTARLVAELLTSNDPTKLAQGMRMAEKNQRIAAGLKDIANRIALSGQQQVAPSAVSRIHISPMQGPVPAGASQEQQ